MIERISAKQRIAWKWPFTSDSSALICDGSVRSGKTFINSMAYIMWAMETFNGKSFALCGKTVGSCIRNVVKPIVNSPELACYYRIKLKRSENLIEIKGRKSANTFYIFGGKDERSQDLIQGLTLSGVYFDEVALMPKSFVDQAIARTLSEAESKLFFNCNPAGPNHWFKKEWIDDRENKKATYLHFRMEDNPIMDQKKIEKASSLYSGVFYERYILGLWVAAEGRIYDCFDTKVNVLKEKPKTYGRYYVSCDYGTQNAMVYLLWQKSNMGWCCIKEYYYSGRDEKAQKTDAEYVDDLKAFLDGIKPEKIIVDPSAASFIAALRKKGYTVQKAKNEVSDGIRNVAVELKAGRLLFWNCPHCKEEFESYIWDEKASANGEDKPVKEHDHCMDAVRYFVHTILYRKAPGLNTGLHGGI